VSKNAGRRRRWEAREDKVERVVEQIIEAEAADAEHAEALFDDMCEHLDDEEVYQAYSGPSDRRDPGGRRRGSAKLGG
jgi:hypothetical protein